MHDILWPVILLVGLALVFDFINGFHDAANSVATVIATGTLKPKQAVVLAFIFNIVGLFIFHLAVAATIGKGIIDPSIVDFNLIAAGLIGAISWNLITWAFGLPSSSSHALIGGVVGAAIAKAGSFDPIVWAGMNKTLLFIVISPLAGMALAAALAFILRRIFPNVKPGNKMYRYGQIISSSLYSIGHGANDAQKTAGIIFLVLIAGGLLSAESDIPYWVAAISFLVIGLGTLAGGWRIIHTMANKITDLKPRGGFAAEMAGSIMLFTSSGLGIPVSTTHAITGSIVGSGAVENAGKIQWGTLRNIVIAWVLTIPAAAIIGGLLYQAFRIVLA